MIGLIIANFTLKYLIGVSTDAEKSFLFSLTGTYMTCFFVMADFGLIWYSLERIGHALRRHQNDEAAVLRQHEVLVKEYTIGG